MHKQKRFARFAWWVLACNLAVIAWGAYVRATGSGAGCGGHWPLCDGQVLPRTPTIQMVIEYSHRLSSGFVMLLAGVLWVWSRLAFPRGHTTRRMAGWALAFTLSEALVGAGLVLFSLVAHNASVYRALAISLHLTNTFILLAFLTLTAHSAEAHAAVRWRRQGAVGWAMAGALAAVLILGISGAVTALGDTLFPAPTLAAGIRQELSPSAHFLVRLRLFHPLTALSVGLFVILVSGLAAHLRPSQAATRVARRIAALFALQLALGALNVLLLAPIALQLAHLLLADLLWIQLVILAATVSADGIPHAELEDAPSDRVQDATDASPVGWRAYVALTKPRVISLLLFTTLAAMFIAKKGWPGTFLLVAVAIGGYMAAGAANALNMVIDRDIDGCMSRTSQRPTVTHQIATPQALAFALALGAGSFAILWAAANLLAAVLAFAGLVYYVIIYTLMLKRRTPQNIVIGGAAGAFPPLVGWAAVTRELNLFAWLLFALIFVWTPVHFWALALLLKDDYAAAGVPMLPCVSGERITVIQIGLYALLTAAISALPLLQKQTGPIYLVGAAILNAVLLMRSADLYRRADRPRASRLFHYSMVYLAALFLVMAVDRMMHA
ncbi:MAG: heme o synthase [Chthonomonadales bacterium]